jgi:hypothetical protein
MKVLMYNLVKRGIKNHVENKRIQGERTLWGGYFKQENVFFWGIIWVQFFFDFI